MEYAVTIVTFVDADHIFTFAWKPHRTVFFNFSTACLTMPHNQQQSQIVEGRDKVRSCEIRSALNIEPRLRIGKISTTVVRYRDQNAQGTIGSGSLVGYTHWKAAQRSSKNQRWCDCISDLANSTAPHLSKFNCAPSEQIRCYQLESQPAKFSFSITDIGANTTNDMFYLVVHYEVTFVWI